jgi:hypothetical protein
MCSRMLHVSCMRMMVDDIDLSMAAYTHTSMLAQGQPARQRRGSTTTQGSKLSEMRNLLQVP